MDTKSLVVYSECTNHGRFKTYYHRKSMIKSGNKKNNRAFKTAMKVHNEKITQGGSSTLPVRVMQSLKVSCTCGVIGLSHFGGVFYGIFSNGSCFVYV